MSHCVDGLLRRYLDEPAAVSDSDRAHLERCPRCRAGLDRARDDRDLAAAVLSTTGAPGAGVDRDVAPDVDAAWAALRERLAGSDPGSAQARFAPGGARRRSRLADRVLRRPVAVAATVGVVLLGGTAAAAAADLIPVFRVEKVTPVSLSAQDVQALDQLGRLAELSAYGEVETPANAEPERVADASAAKARTGLEPPAVDSLPRGVQGDPQYYVVDQQTMKITFSADKLERAAKQAGVDLPPVPRGLDGTRLQIKGGPGVAEVWQKSAGTPTLVVARATALTASSEGASLAVVRDYLLAMPGLSPALRDQVRNLTGDGTTLLLPVPQELATSSQADVGGVRATVVESKDGALAAVVWVRDGTMNAVLGPVSRSEVLAVARGLS